MIAERAEEILQHPAGLRLRDAGDDVRAVAAGRALKHPRAMLNPAALRVVGPENQAADARMLDGATRLVLNQFFTALASSTTRSAETSWWSRLWQRVRSP